MKSRDAPAKDASGVDATGRSGRSDVEYYECIYLFEGGYRYSLTKNQSYSIALFGYFELNFQVPSLWTSLDWHSLTPRH